jgi:hypothetical protein
LSSLSEFNKLIGQSHQFVLDLRILTPGGNFQKLYHDPFQTLARFGVSPFPEAVSCLRAIIIPTAAILAVVFSSRKSARI